MTLDALRNRIGSAVPVVIPAVAVLAILCGSWFRWFDVYEYETYDWRFHLRPQQPVSGDIAIVEIWDDSLEQLGRWPIDRGYHAFLTEVLRASGARMIGFDILFVEPGEGDDELAQASKSFGPVFFSEVFSSIRSEKGRGVAEKIQTPLLEKFRAAGKGVGHVNAVIDADGKRRRVMPVISSEDGQVRWQLGVRMAADYLGVSPEAMTVDTRGRPKIGDIRLPVDPNGGLLVNFAGKWSETYIRISYVDILKSFQQMEAGEKPRIDLGILKNKVCFIGLTATGTHDINPIPLEIAYPQVGIHADVLNMVLNRSFILRIGRIANIALLFLIGLAAVSFARVRKLTVSLGAYLASVLVFVAVSVAAFAFARIWADLFYPVVASGLVYLWGMIQRTLSEMRKRELMEAELVIASNIQKSFLPSSVPVFPALDMSVYMKPAKHVGGDLYTMFVLDGKRFGLMLGDVSGKGTPAALFMAKAVSEFKFHARSVADPARALTALNESLSSEEAGGLFVTMSYAVFDMERRMVRLSCGGHLPLLRVKKDGTSEYVNADGGMPLALMPDVEFGNLDIPLEEGDIFVLYSDGIQEAKNLKRQDFELERLAECVKQTKDLPAADIQKRILEDIHRFVKNAPQHDDMTLIVTKIAPSA